ncbi:hypothetical protein QFC21_006558 [Naganishia friedmannii]|uniref:Uncharacterized protein n=1 Tax=Naganishia friedmannii TaxID=89922 RepID=A0ACC2V1S2_9TREE|nr:hypothetical protein QFC21_006558 [Naganishia friedmannii]
MTIPHPPTASKTRRIAIIGAGAAGLAQAKQVLVDAAFPQDGDGGDGVELVVFESRNDVGGVWLENPTAGDYVVQSHPETNTTRILPSHAGVLPSPIYPGLRTNLPKQLMAYRSHPFPGPTPLFPRAHHVETYLRTYAEQHDLVPHIRFETTVTRVYKETSADLDVGGGDGEAKWVVESRHGAHGPTMASEVFDFVCIASGHYEKASIPEIRGLDKFTGQVLHSRWYRRPETFIGKNVLVIGSFASGSDIARELASVNLPLSVLPESMTSHGPARPADEEETTHDDAAAADERKIRVYQSSSQTPNMFTSGLAADSEEEDGKRPWLRLIEQRPLIDRIETPGSTPTTTTPSSPSTSTTPAPAAGRKSSSIIHFNDGSTLTDIDVIIFATGYLYYYPFLKRADYPWNRQSETVLDGVVGEVDVLAGGDAEGGKDMGGLQGLGMRQMDELMLFLKNDRSIAFIGLPYQVVPFPLFEIQSHLVALLWAGRLPHFPTYPRLPPNPLHEAPPTTPPETPKDASSSGEPTSHHAQSDSNGVSKQATPPGTEKRYTERVRGAYVFGFPYEFHYENYLLSLTAEADGGKEGGWGEVEDFRWFWRKQKELRFQTIGY